MKFLLLMLGVFFSAALGAAELGLRVQGKNFNGKEVRVALYSSAHGFPDKDDQARISKAVATDDEITFHFSDLPPGEYAASAFVDSNGNAKLDSNFIGKPTEPYGFSRDARGLMGPPSFAEAAFRIGEARVTQTLHLK